MSANTFRAHIRKSIADENLQIALDGNARRRKDGRLEAFKSLPDPAACRARAHAIKADVISHLDEYLSRFISQATMNGVQVHRAEDSKAALRLSLIHI